MKASNLVRENAVAYVAVLFLFGFVIAYQLRSSLETIHLERNLDFYVPFLLQPFTNRIADGDHVKSWEEGSQWYDAGKPHSVLHWRDELLSVNGRPFRGMSTYLGELKRTQYRPDPLPPDFQWYPFILNVRWSDSSIHRVEVGFPHCTCGIPGAFEAAATWLIPPVFCVVLGFATVCCRPRAVLAWAFLGLMLSLSQLQFWPDWYPGFQQTSTPMAWSDWFRIPASGYRAFVQHAWPAAILLAAAHMNRGQRTFRKLALLSAAAFLLFALLHGALQIAWSEDYQRFAPLYGLLERHRTELTAASLGVVAVLAWFRSRRFGLVVLGAVLLAATALYWSRPITQGTWIEYSDNIPRFDVSVPSFHNTPGFIVLLFAGTCILGSLIFFRKSVTVRDTVGLLLCVPLATDAAARLGGYWYPVSRGPFPDYWPWLVLILAGLGLWGLSWSVLRRTIPASA